MVWWLPYSYVFSIRLRLGDMSLFFRMFCLLTDREIVLLVLRLWVLTDYALWLASA